MKVVWTPRARGDLLRIRDYLREHSPKAAKKIVDRIVERVGKQVRMPFAAPIERDGPERCLVVARTPYLVLYRIAGDELQIVAIYHAAQDR